MTFNSVLGDYYKNASQSKQQISFSQWIKTNYLVYSSNNESPSAGPKYEGDYEDESPSYERTMWENIYEMAQYSLNEEVKTHARLLRSNEVSNAYSKFMSESSSSKDSTSFVDFACSSLQLTEPSQFSFNFFKKKSEEEKARQKQTAEIKKRENEKQLEAKNQTEHTLNQLKAVAKTKQVELEQLKKRDVESNILKERIQKLDKDIEEKKQQMKENASAGEAKQSQVMIYKWTDKDARPIMELLSLPESLTVNKTKKIGEFIDKVIVNNHSLKTRLEPSKNRLGIVTDMHIYKLLSVIKSYPDHWESGKTKTPKTKYTGTGKYIENPGEFTIADHYDVYLAFNAICETKEYEDITKQKLESVKKSKFQSFKEKISGEPKVTVEWGDDMAKALADKLMDKTKGVHVDLINKMSLFVKHLCKNKELNSIRSQVKNYLNKSKYPPYTDAALAILMSICAFNPTRGPDGEMLTQYAETDERAILVTFTKGEVDELEPFLQVQAYNVYQRLLDVRKNQSFPFDDMAMHVQPSAGKIDPMSALSLPTELDPQERIFTDCIKEISQRSWTFDEYRVYETTINDILENPVVKDSAISSDIVKVFTCYLQFVLANSIEHRYNDSESVVIEKER